MSVFLPSAAGLVDAEGGDPAWIVADDVVPDGKRVLVVPRPVKQRARTGGSGMVDLSSVAEQRGRRIHPRCPIGRRGTRRGGYWMARPADGRGVQGGEQPGPARLQPQSQDRRGVAGAVEGAR